MSDFREQGSAFKTREGSVFFGTVCGGAARAKVGSLRVPTLEGSDERLQRRVRPPPFEDPTCELRCVTASSVCMVALLRGPYAPW